MTLTACAGFNEPPNLVEAIYFMRLTNLLPTRSTFFPYTTLFRSWRQIYVNHQLKKATFAGGCFWCMVKPFDQWDGIHQVVRSEEHTSELQSRGHLVCRLLLEKQPTLTNERCLPVPR